LVIINTVPEPARPHIRSLLKGFEKRTTTRMFGTGREQALGGVKPCITMSSYHSYASSHLVTVAISKRVILEENVTGKEDI
jgi:hypothetical protein